MLTQARLKSLFTYNPDDGVFTRIKTQSNRSKVEKTVGWVTEHGYIRCSVDYKKYFLHRLAFLYMNGYFPEYQIDHKNGIKKDNRWVNLRHVSRKCNMQNTKTFITNKSGFTGVYYSKRDKTWWSQARVDDRKVFLGNHDTALDAALARYTFEVQCPKWKCNHRSELAKAIKIQWPEFRL